MKFRTHCLIGVIVVLLLASSAAHAASLSWLKHVSVDGSFSFHYPEGWHVTESESVVVVDGPSSDEQLCMCILPYYRNWSPEEHAQLMEVQQALAEAVLEWIGETDPSDPVVQMIHARVLEGDKTLADGDPPLTETAALSYAELMAYAELLQSDPAAGLNSISQGIVEEIRSQLVEHWRQFSQNEREQIQAAPAVWTTLRQALLHGDSSDREKARGIIVKLAPEKGSGDASRGAASDDEFHTSMLAHQNMLWASQNAFNHWRWCMGYTRTIWGY